MGLSPDPRPAACGTWREGGNVGVGCRSGRIIVLDIDGAEGIFTCAELSEHHLQAPPETMAVATPHGVLTTRGNPRVRGVDFQAAGRNRS